MHREVTSWTQIPHAGVKLKQVRTRAILLNLALVWRRLAIRGPSYRGHFVGRPL